MGTFDRNAIRLALNAKCASATSIRRAHAYVVERIEETPCTYISGSDSLDFNVAYGRGKVLCTFRVILVVGRLDVVDSQKTMDLLLSNLPLGDPDDVLDGAPITLKDALESDQTLGGVCKTVLVKSADDMRAVTIAAQEYLAVDLVVEVRT